MGKMRRFWDSLFQKGVSINVAWIIGLVFAGWAAVAFYIVITGALEAVESRVHVTEALRERDQQIELKEELEAKARALGVELPNPPPEEVLAPSREAYLKEYWRMQRLVRPGEFIASYPASFPTLSEPSAAQENPFSSPLEAWKALLGFGRPCER